MPKDCSSKADERNGWRILNWNYLFRPHDLFASIVYSIAIMLLLVGAAMFAVILFHTVKAAADGDADNINKLLLALAGLLGAPFVVWRVLIANRQNHIAQENLYTTMLAKAVEQLGAMREEKKSRIRDDGNVETLVGTVSNTEVRLGAIYALEKLARDYEPLHWPIMETLCAYVRENAGRPSIETLQGKFVHAQTMRSRTALLSSIDLGQSIAEDRRKRKEGLVTVSVDVQAALTVIGRRPESRRIEEARRRDAAPKGDAWRLDLTNSYLARADFSGLHFEGAKFDGSDLECGLFDRAVLDEASFQRAHLEGVQFYRTRLAKCSFVSAYLEGAGFRECNVVGANFQLAALEAGGFLFVHAEGADFSRAKLQYTVFFNTALRGAFFHDAKLCETEFKNCPFDDVFCGMTNFKHATGLVDLHFASAWGDSSTVLPESVSRPANDRWIAEYQKSWFDAWENRRQMHIESTLDWEPSPSYS